MTELKILFICIANTCRSPMAEAMARSLGEGKVEAFSAGFTPTSGVASGSIQALEELGYSTDGLKPKGFHEVPLNEMDVIVSLIGNDGLRFLPPSLPAERVSWFVRDPYGEDEEAFFKAAGIIEGKIKELLKNQLGGREPLLL